MRYLSYSRPVPRPLSEGWTQAFQPGMGRVEEGGRGVVTKGSSHGSARLIYSNSCVVRLTEVVHRGGTIGCSRLLRTPSEQ